MAWNHTKASKKRQQKKAMKAETGLLISGQSYYRLDEGFSIDDDDALSRYLAKVQVELRWNFLSSSLINRKNRINEINIEGELERIELERNRIGKLIDRQKDYFQSEYDSLLSGVLKLRIDNLQLLADAQQHLVGDRSITTDELLKTMDEQAIAETDRKYGKVCMQVSMNILDSRPDAEECVSDTYLKTWNSIPPQRPNCLKAFLTKITRTIAIDRYRQNRRRAENRELEEAILELSPAMWVPDSAEGELKYLLSDFLRKLSEEERRLFMGRYWHGYTVHDLAEHYGLTPNAVTKRLGRTREKLRDYLNEKGYGYETTNR